MKQVFKKGMVIVILCWNTCFNCGYAQHFNSSVYSAYGVGEIVPKGSGLNAMLGGSGIALCDSMNINVVNPASYAGIYSKITQLTSLSLDLTFGKWVNGSNVFRNAELSFPGLALWFRPASRTGLCIGLTPYSKVDYNLEKTNSYDGMSGTYSVNYTGNGGLSRFFIGGAFSPVKNLSVGLHASYYFGPINQYQFIDAESGLGLYYSIEDLTFLKAFQLDYGIQYAIKAGKSKFTIGATYNMEKGLSGTRNYQLLSETDTLEHTESNITGISLPQSVGAGIEWTYNNKWKLTGDFQWEDWKKFADNNGFHSKNAFRYSGGIEKMPDLNSLKPLERLGFAVGGYYRISYMTINDESVDDYGFSVGLIIPTGGKSLFNVAYQRSFRTFNSENFINEYYHGFMVSMSLFDFWFNKNKYK